MEVFSPSMIWITKRSSTKSKEKKEKLLLKMKIRKVLKNIIRAPSSSSSSTTSSSSSSSLCKRTLVIIIIIIIDSFLIQVDCVDWCECYWWHGADWCSWISSHNDSVSCCHYSCSWLDFIFSSSVLQHPLLQVSSHGCSYET